MEEDSILEIVAQSSQTAEIASDVGKESFVVSSQCIFPIPKFLRAEKLGAYVPRVVSLGPFHFRQSHLSDHETFKTQLLQRLDDRDCRAPFSELIDVIINRINIRQWYGLFDCSLSDRDLASMMARDGLFLLQFLRHGLLFNRKSSSFGFGPSSPIYDIFNRLFQPERGILPIAVQEDIMKLENQIPMPILQMVLQWEAGTDRELGTILETAWQLLCPFLYIRVRQHSRRVFAKDALRAKSHLLRFVYENINRSASSYKRQTEVIRETKDKTDITLPSAVELKIAGVKFAAVGLLEEISFDSRNCTFRLPTIEMDERTEAVMRNLVAFEAFAWKKKTKPLTCYVDLMDRLINTAEDVLVLRKGDIIVSHMGSNEEVARVWNGMAKSLWRGQYEPIDTAIRHVTSFSTSKYRRMYAEFKQKYFSRPWVAVGFVAGCILTISSLLQTIFAWLSFYNKHP